MTSQHHPFANPASPAFGIASTAIMGAIALIDPVTLDERRRGTLHLASAVTTALYIGVTIRSERRALRVLAGLSSGLVTLRFADTGDVIDARLAAKLRNSGVKHPRRWIAAGTAAMIFAGFLGDRAAAKKAADLEAAGAAEVSAER